jgi:Protein of unknown function (DUF2510)
VETQPTHAEGGWHPDPWHRFEFRYFNGVQWTSDVSLNGQRYVDAPIVPQLSQPRRSRAMAITSFVAGAIGLLLGWVPFVFVLAACAAVAAIVFGVLGLNVARRNDGYGRGFAIAGLVLAPLALGACVVGLTLTRSVVHEFNKFIDPGPQQLTEDQPCVVNNGRATLRGTIRNLDTRRHDYRLVVEFRDTSPRPITTTVLVTGVDSGETTQWESSASVDSTAVTCKVTGVFGPLPFGADPQS